MKPSESDHSAMSIEQLFYGSVTVGERGQVVIPAKARRDYGIETGDQLLIVGHPTKSGIMISKVDAIQAFMTKILGDLRFIESMHSAPAADEAQTPETDGESEPEA